MKKGKPCSPACADLRKTRGLSELIEPATLASQRRQFICTTDLHCLNNCFIGKRLRWLR